MAAYQIPVTQQFFDNNGNPLAGGKIYTCIAGAASTASSNLQTTYTDYNGTTANTNPVILDSSGRANIWGNNAAYKIFIYSSADVLIRSEDNISPVLGSSPVSTIADASITTAKIADNAVATIKVADSAITTAKLADSAATTAKIADSAVTYAKLASTVSAASSDVTTGTSTTQFITPYALELGS